MDAKLVLHTIIDEYAELHPGAVAIDESGGHTTYGELSKQSQLLAHTLVDAGLNHGDPAGIYLPASAGYVIAAMAVNKAGGMFMPLELNYPVERMIALLSLVQPKIIITGSKYAGEICAILYRISPGIEATIILIDRKENNSFQAIDIAGDVKEIEPVNGTLPLVTGNDSAYLIYTSGSTGMPKVIEGMHKSLSHFIHWEQRQFDLDSTVRVSQLAPLSFDVSLRDIYTPLLSGGTLCIPSADLKRNPDQLLNWFEEKQVSLVHIVPSLFRVLTDVVQNAGADKTRFIGYMLLAGEALYTNDVIKWRKAAGEKTLLVNLYGPSETTLAKVFNIIGEMDDSSNEVIPLGSPLPNTSLLLLQNNRPVMTGAVGEIYIRTPFRSKGYYKNPALSSERFLQNPLHNNYTDIVYRTGDMGKILKDGRLAFMGREDRQVKIRGNRVELHEVELVVKNFPGIDQVFIHPFVNNNQDTYLVLYYTGATPVNEADLQHYLDEHLPNYMHPSFTLYMKEFPLSLNGKIDRNQLPRPEELLYQSMSYEEPKGDIEKRIADIWAKTLGISKIGRNNSFFELGGHSLAAFKIVSAISKEFEKDISLKDFFDYPKVADLARLVNEQMMDEIII